MKFNSRALFIVILLAVLVLSGCESRSTLTVKNETSGDININIDGYERVVESGKTGSKNWKLNDWFLSHETKDITVSGDGDFKTSFSYNYTIWPDKDKVVNIDPDAGQVWFHNFTANPINQIYFTYSQSPSWGVNRLDGHIEPGDSSFWPVPAGYNDFEIFDIYSNRWTGFDFYIASDTRYNFNILPPSTLQSDSPIAVAPNGPLQRTR